jgi:GT2 family glycosyltransferase
LIDVIIPVYKGLLQTRRCIDSVLRSAQATPFEVVAIDDASPDPEISRHLREMAEQGRITLLRNESNLGFVHSVNRGMALHPERDVVLLNSDTEVANDWLDRLRRCACGQPDVGTVTPFSNSATICSYPFEGWTKGVPGTLGLAALDRLFATANAGRTVELPTAVGFCMYIRRACLDRVGLFDADRFGRGYGEENDFCMRAAGAGWRNVLAGDVFVYHEGAVSFAEERPALTENAGKALADLHPDYVRKVREFVMRDPASALRAAVDGARIALGTDELRQLLVERTEERSLLKNRLTEAEHYAEEREPLIAKLRSGLALAETLLAERDPEILAYTGEIARLRSGLSHAEALAFARAQEIEELHRSWIWKCREFVLRIRSGRRPPPQA